MRLEPSRLVVACGGDTSAVDLADPAGPARLEVADFGLVVEVHGAHGEAIGWAVRNDSTSSRPIRSVALVHRLTGIAEPLRIFRNGYQSWTPTGMATFGEDADPSTVADLEFLQAVHHADQRTAPPGELRSEWFTVLVDGDGDLAYVLGFEACSTHDGTFRLRPAPDGDGVELWTEAFLGDAVLPAGEGRRLHDVTITGGDGTPAHELLERWADRTGTSARARTDAPYQVGWCSWYHYFHDVTEEDIGHNLAIAARDRWPFDVFQVDDGYQAAIGDWLTTNERFPAGVAAVADAIRAAGYTAGIWLAPFLAAPDSRVAVEHPDWLARRSHPERGTTPLYCWWNPPWGGGHDGMMYGLDTSNPEVLAHLRSVAAALVDLGFTYLKLDFTFAPSVDGIWHDPTWTPAERVRAGYAAIREGAGDDAFLLGCGVPLANVVGLVDANRIGQDVAPLWALAPEDEVVAGYLGIQPATKHAFGNTLARAFLHRRLWLNDPDCLMLRTDRTDLTPDAARTWARTVGLSGGLALVSDDLALLGIDARDALDETIDLGRDSDARARQGRTPSVPDLVTAPVPTTISAGRHLLEVEIVSGGSSLDPNPPDSGRH